MKPIHYIQMHDHDEITMEIVHNMNLAAAAASSNAFSHTKP
jgi:hypothetical protein